MLTLADLIWTGRRWEVRTEDGFVSLDEVMAEIKRYQQWVNDLQSGMYVNCAYCGHRYGPADKVPASMAEALKAHIEQCPKHPMSQLKADLARVTAQRDAAMKDIPRCCDTCEWYRPSCGGIGTQKCVRGGYNPSASMGCSSWAWRGPRKEDGGNDD